MILLPMICTYWVSYLYKNMKNVRPLSALYSKRILDNLKCVFQCWNRAPSGQVYDGDELCRRMFIWRLKLTDSASQHNGTVVLELAFTHVHGIWYPEEHWRLQYIAMPSAYNAVKMTLRLRVSKNIIMEEWGITDELPPNHTLLGTLSYWLSCYCSNSGEMLGEWLISINYHRT